jgi:hypothetical protein
MNIATIDVMNPRIRVTWNTDRLYGVVPCWHGLSIRQGTMAVGNEDERNSMSARACNAYIQ